MEELESELVMSGILQVQETHSKRLSKKKLRIFLESDFVISLKEIVHCSVKATVGERRDFNQCRIHNTGNNRFTHLVRKE